MCRPPPPRPARGPGRRGAQRLVRRVGHRRLPHALELGLERPQRVLEAQQQHEGVVGEQPAVTPQQPLHGAVEPHGEPGRGRQQLEHGPAARQVARGARGAEEGAQPPHLGARQPRRGLPLEATAQGVDPARGRVAEQGADEQRHDNFEGERRPPQRWGADAKPGAADQGRAPHPASTWP
jgi:hypothetical protein